MPRRHRSAVALVPLLAAAASALLVLAQALAQTQTEDARQAANDLVALTNVDRTSNRLPALALDERLEQVALARSQDMHDRGYFSHTIPPDGRTFADLLRERGVVYRAAGENLGFNTTAGGRPPRSVQREFMNSPTHRALVLDSRFDHLGVGVVHGRRDNAPLNLYTVLFADLGGAGPSTRPAPTTESPPRPPQPTAGPSPTPAARPPAPLASAPRLAPAAPGLIENLVNRTLRLYLGL